MRWTLKSWMFTAALVSLVSCGTDASTVQPRPQDSIGSPAAPSASDRALFYSGRRVSDNKGSWVASGLDLPPAAPGGTELSPMVLPYGSGVLYLAIPAQSTSPMIPELRLAGGAEEIVVSSMASSVAVSATGAIATAEPAEGIDGLWVSDVMVRATPSSPAERWSSEVSNYAVLAWAGKVLLVIKNPGESGEPIELLAYDGPGKVRVLHPNAGLIAVSPDGRRALLSTSTDAGNDTELVDPASGDDIGVVDTSLLGEPVIVGQGSWSTAGVVATIWVGDEQRLGLFDADERGLTLTKSVTLPQNVLYGLNEPYLFGRTGSEVGSGWARNADVRPRSDGSYDTTPYLHVVCDFALNECTSTTVGDAAFQIGRKRNPSGGESDEFQLIPEQR